MREMPEYDLYRVRMLTGITLPRPKARRYATPRAITRGGCREDILRSGPTMLHLRGVDKADEEEK